MKKIDPTNGVELFPYVVDYYNKGKLDGKMEAILQQANHDQAVKYAYEQGKEEEMRRITGVIEHYRANEGDCAMCYNCISEILEQLKEQE